VPMKNPVHPGRVIRQDCLEPLDLSVTAGARALGVTRQALNNVVNEKAAISPEMAVRLSKAFGGEAETWLAMQAAFDLAQLRRRAGDNQGEAGAGSPVTTHAEAQPSLSLRNRSMIPAGKNMSSLIAAISSASFQRASSVASSPSSARRSSAS